MSESQTASIWGWRGATPGVSLRLKRILGTGERSDVQFVVGRQHGEERFFRAHRLVLSLGSDVFDTMFYGEIPPTTEQIIELPDILPQAFDVMLKYLYTDVVENLSLENALPTLYCAKKYGIPDLVDICAQYAIRNVEKGTCLTMLEAAKILDADGVVKRCLEIVDTYCSELLLTQAFLQLKSETLGLMFSRDTLIAKEEELYKAAERWASNACRTNQLESTATNHRRMLGDALFLVRFPLMDDGQLVNGPGATGLLLNEELLKIYQFKHAARKPDIPFSGIPRASNIAFCDRQWLVVDSSDGNIRIVTARNVFVDDRGHVHLRFSQHNGVWKGAAIRSANALGFGIYEFHIEGLDQLDCNVDFALYSQAEHEPRVGIEFVKWSEDYERQRDGSHMHQNRCMVRFAVRYRSSPPPTPRNVVGCDRTVVMDRYTTHVYNRQEDSVDFRSQRGHQHNTNNGEYCNWSYESRPTIPQKAIPVFIRLSNRRGNAPCAGKEMEIIVHSFRFYPAE